MAFVWLRFGPLILGCGGLLVLMAYGRSLKEEQQSLRGIRSSLGTTGFPVQEYASKNARCNRAFGGFLGFALVSPRASGLRGRFVFGPLGAFFGPFAVFWGGLLGVWALKWLMADPRRRSSSVCPNIDAA